MTFSVEWQETHVDALKANHASGMSYAQNAADINATFGTSYSRNACIGKGKRVGLAKEAQPRVKVVRENAVTPRFVTPKLAAERHHAQAAQLRCAAIEPLNILIHELTKLTCRWPYGERAPYVYCGHLPFAGSSYCAAHTVLATGPGTSSEQSAHRGVPE